MNSLGKNIDTTKKNKALINASREVYRLEAEEWPHMHSSSLIPWQKENVIYNNATLNPRTADYQPIQNLLSSHLPYKN